MSRPVSELSCSLTCRAGFGLSLYARFNDSSCFAVIVVRGRLLAESKSNSEMVEVLNGSQRVTRDFAIGNCGFNIALGM
jgi:hypothetical protein